MRRVVKSLERWESADGKSRATLYDLGDGRFSFTEEALKFEDMSDVDLASFTYWGPVYDSGFYASAADAERDARAMIPWLRDIPPSLT